jgi:hypothetical protein
MIIYEFSQEVIDLINSILHNINYSSNMIILIYGYDT